MKNKTVEQLTREMLDTAIALNSIYEKLAMQNMIAANGTLDQCIEYLNDKRVLSASHPDFIKKAEKMFGLS